MTHLQAHSDEFRFKMNNETKGRGVRKNPWLLDGKRVFSKGSIYVLMFLLFYEYRQPKMRWTPITQWARKR